MQSPTFRLAGVVQSAREAMEDFEGPLDLILHLLSKNKIEIRDIKISELLQQYLDYLEQMKRMDLEIATEFVSMASHLVYIKSRMLLSLSSEQSEEELSELMQALEQRRQQEEYRRVAAAREYLSARADIGRSIFVKRPEALPEEKTYGYIHEAGELTAALREMHGRAERRKPPTPAAFSGIVGREPHSVGDMIALIVRRLTHKGRQMFSGLLRRSDRSEKVAAFLALLELCRSRRVRVEECGDDYELTMTEE